MLSRMLALSGEVVFFYVGWSLLDMLVHFAGK